MRAQADAHWTHDTQTCAQLRTCRVLHMFSSHVMVIPSRA